MPIPSKTDLAKHQAAIKKYQGYLGDDNRVRPKAQLNMLRSAIRQVWMHHPVKLLKLQLARIPDMDTTTRTKWLYECEICHELFKGADVEVDHINGHHAFATVEDILPYYEYILNVTIDDLQVACKPCHAIKTHMERNPGMTWDEAVVDKQVIAKLNQSVMRQKKELLALGYGSKEISNKEKRKAIYTDYLLNKAQTA